MDTLLKGDAGNEYRAALAEEKRVIRERLTAAVTNLEPAAKAAREHAWMAQHSIIRADALATFVRNGGTRAQFDRLWPNALEEVLDSVLLLRRTSRTEA